MAAQIIDGKKLAEIIRRDIAGTVKTRNIKTKLVDIVIGNDPNSQLFANLKGKAAREVGIDFEKKSFPDRFEPRFILDYIQELNDDKRVGGIVIQLPVPDFYKQHLLLKSIHPFKDVDCLHPKNLGLLLVGQPVFIPPVTLAVLEAIRSTKKYPEKEYRSLEDDHNIFAIPNLEGTRIALLGGGLLVGKPLAAFLINLGATVTIMNEFTQNTSNLTLNSEIIITGTNQSNILNPLSVTDGAIVIDVGNDIDSNLFLERDIYLSKNPGGIGPLTIAFLLQNVIRTVLK